MSSARRKLAILYRGPLSSCNYACDYCPFAKRTEGAEELARDRAALDRFLAWVEERTDLDLSVFFTPWGEALVRPWYQEALVRLTLLDHVEKAAIQTNLSPKLEWIAEALPEKLGLWSTFHPTEVSRERFVARVLEARDRGARVSAGVVGLKEHLDEIEALRRELPPDVYVWVNAYKRVPGYYSSHDRERLERVDPLFHWNTSYHASLGRSCRTGESVVSVDGDGVVRRCHFVKEPIANLYEPGSLDAALRERPCPNATCGCHIGYVHLDHLGLRNVYGAGLLERIPAPRA